MTITRAEVELLMVDGNVLDQLAALTRRPPWMRDAACQEYPDVDFHARDPATVSRALSICAGCLVRLECSIYARDNGERFGVWGGKSMERERRAARLGAA